eukprot:51700-Chlamydomonas_euryale.AAC.1
MERSNHLVLRPMHANAAAAIAAAVDNSPTVEGASRGATMHYAATTPGLRPHTRECVPGRTWSCPARRRLIAVVQGDDLK